MRTKRVFLIADSFDIPQDLAGFRPPRHWHGASTETLEVTYYDTFDWRLHDADTRLVLEKSVQTLFLYRHHPAKGERRDGTPVSKPPNFAWNLPFGPLRDALAPLLDVRRLLPTIRIKCRIQPYVLMNRDEKITLRIYKEQARAIHPHSGKSLTLGTRLYVQPLKGYSKAYDGLIKHLLEHHQLEEAGDLYEQASAAFGIEPGDYTSKLKLKLDPEARSDASIKQFLAVLLQTMERNEAGIEHDWDAEFLHDFRVAGRRARSAIGQIKDIMPSNVLQRLKREFAWLNQVSGPSRDMDVYLLGFPAYQASLPQDLRKDLNPLREFLKDHKQAEYTKLVHALHSARYRNFKAYLRKYLDTPVVERTTLAHARQPIAEVSGQRIWRVFRRVIKEGKAITDTSPNEALHELRKTCKKLRYLLEFTRSLYHQQEIDDLIKTLKKLQDNLGEFQDYSVQTDALQGFSRQMLAEGRANATTLVAITRLVDALGQRQQDVRKVFQRRFDQFANAETQTRFRQLFHAKPQKVETP